MTPYRRHAFAMSDAGFRAAILGWTTPEGERSDRLLWDYVNGRRTRDQIQEEIGQEQERRRG